MDDGGVSIFKPMRPRKRVNRAGYAPSQQLFHCHIFSYFCLNSHSFHHKAIPFPNFKASQPFWHQLKKASTFNCFASTISLPLSGKYGYPTFTHTPLLFTPVFSSMLLFIYLPVSQKSCPVTGTPPYPKRVAVAQE